MPFCTYPVLCQLCELHGIAELRHGVLRLRIPGDQVLLRFADAEQRDVDLVMDLGLDEVEILLERVLVDLHFLVLKERPEVVDHAIVDGEALCNAPLPLRGGAHARVTFSRVALREVEERRPAEQHAAEARGIESLDGTEEK